MKAIVIWSRGTDRRILAGAGVAGTLAFAALAGFLLPPPAPYCQIWLLDGLITSALLVFVWSGSHLMRPSRYTHKWVTVQYTTIPIVWALLVGALAIWFYYLNADWQSTYERVMRESESLFHTIL